MTALISHVSKAEQGRASSHVASSEHAEAEQQEREQKKSKNNHWWKRVKNTFSEKQFLSYSYLTIIDCHHDNHIRIQNASWNQTLKWDFDLKLQIFKLSFLCSQNWLMGKQKLMEAQLIKLKTPLCLWTHLVKLLYR